MKEEKFCAYLCEIIDRLIVSGLTEREAVSLVSGFIIAVRADEYFTALPVQRFPA